MVSIKAVFASTKGFTFDTVFKFGGFREYKIFRHRNWFSYFLGFVKLVVNIELI